MNFEEIRICLVVDQVRAKGMDLVSRSVQHDVSALRRFAALHRLRLRHRVYTKQSDWLDSCVQVVASPRELTNDLFFNQSQTIVWYTGYRNTLLEAMSWAPTWSKRLVLATDWADPRRVPLSHRATAIEAHAALQFAFLAEQVAVSELSVGRELLRIGLSPSRLVWLPGVNQDDRPMRDGERSAETTSDLRLLVPLWLMSADSVDSLSSSVIEAVKSERADIRLNLLGSHLESNPELRRRLETNFQKVCMADMIASRMPDGAENLVGMLRSHDVLYLPAESGKVSTPSAPEASDLAVWALSEGCQVFAIGGAERLGDAAALVRSDARGDARSIAAKLREMLMLAKLGALPTDSGVRGLVEWRAEAIPSGRALLGDRSASRRVSWMESACREAESLLRRSDRERLATRRLAILGTNGEAAVTSDGPSPLARKRDLILERVFDSARTPYVDSSQQAPFDPTSESFHMNRSIRVRLRGMWIRSKGGIKRIPILGPVARRIYRVVKRLTRPAPAFDQAAALRELQGEIGTIRGDLVALYRLIESGIKARESDHEPVSEWTESHHRDHLDNVRDRLEHLASQVRDNSDTTRYLVEKYMLLAREAREHRADRAERAAVPEPRIIDRAGYEQRLERTGGLIRLNLGCGDRILPDYVNVDRRHLPGSQIIADVRALPFSPESVDEIASSHLIEHFRELQFRTYILPYWKSLLVAGGRLRIVCPNWAAMLSRVADGRVSLEDFRSVTFGFQDFEGDDHFAMYTPQTLTQLLIEEGFERVEVVVEERTNGLCQEMELIAYRNRDDGGGARSVQPPTIASAA